MIELARQLGVQEVGSQVHKIAGNRGVQINDTYLLLMYNTRNTPATPLNNAHPGGFFYLED